ncbi:MAG: hypothetical protein IH795_10895, partial [Bacteroidetes bacterium]|nr:hypothetical protein [Bacteroidota bacterium]
LFFENFGGAEHKISRFGDCLPKDFEFEKEVGEVTNLFWVAGGGKDPFELQDLIDTPKERDTCGDGRQQVTWIFAKSEGGNGMLALHPDPAGMELNVASIQFKAKFKVGEEDWHYNRAWVELNSTDVVDTGETSPVIVEFSNFNV